MYAKNKKRAFKNENELLKEGFVKIYIDNDKKYKIIGQVLLAIPMAIVLFIASMVIQKNSREFFISFLEINPFFILSMLYSLLSVSFHEGLHCMALGWKSSYLLSTTRSYGNKSVNKSRFLFSLLLPTFINLMIFGIFIFLSMVQNMLAVLFLLALAFVFNSIGAMVDVDIFIFIVKTYQHKEVFINTCVDSGYILVKEITNDTLSYDMGIKKPQPI